MIETSELSEIIMRCYQTDILTWMDEIHVNALHDEMKEHLIRLEEIEQKRENRWYKRFWRYMIHGN